MINASTRPFLLCVVIVGLLRVGVGQNEVRTQATAAPASTRQNSVLDNPDEIIRDAEILVFDRCATYDEETNTLSTSCPIEVVYTLNHDLTEGRIQVFNGFVLKVEAEYPLPDLTAGKHLTTLSKGFYWRGGDMEEWLPDPLVYFALGSSPINDLVTSLWTKSDASTSDASAYDYKPEPCTKYEGDLCDEAAMFRGDDVGISNVYIPGRRNLQLRATGDLPEVEILGVGFVEGTEVEYGKGIGYGPIYKATLRDVRVVSTVSHDADENIPVLKAGRFTVPKEIFEYPSHIRIVGKVK